VAKLNRESAHVFREEVALERFKNLGEKECGEARLRVMGGERQADRAANPSAGNRSFSAHFGSFSLRELCGLRF